MGSEEVRANLRASCIGRRLHPNTAAKLLEAAKRPKSEEWKKGRAARSRAMWANPEKYGLPAQHFWTDDEFALLGEKSDKEVGKLLGLPAHVVAYKRQSLGIRGSVLDDWHDDEVALLGTEEDSKVARKLGRSLFSVRSKRQKLGIPPFSVRWSDEEIALLGTDTDSNIAQRIGWHARTIRKKRKEMGIPPFLARWTEKELFWLGRDADAAIASMLGRTERAIATQRHLRGIPACKALGD